MANADQDDRWQKTRTLALASLAGAAAVAIMVAVAGAFEGERTDGFPLAYILATTLAPIALTILVFWFARRQKALDRQYGFFED